MATAAGVDGRTPPQALDAERAVLGSMLLDADALETAAELLREGMFYRPAHQAAWRAILAVHRRGEAVDLVTVGDELEGSGHLQSAGGHAYLAELAGSVPSAASVGHYAAIVRRMHQFRGLITLASDLQRRAYAADEDPDQLLAVADEALSRVQDAVATRREPVSLAAVANDVLGEIERREPMPGTPTGWRDIDRYIGGVRPGELVIVGGRPSSGKTAFGLALAQRLATPNAPALVVSLETSDRPLAYRAIAQASGVSVQLLMRRMASRDQVAHARERAAVWDEHPVWIDDGSHATVADVEAAARRLQRRRGLGVIVLDYLTLVDAQAGRQESRASAVERVAYGLLATAKRLHVPVVALAQLNRQSEYRNVHVPTLADLRESGGIEQAANIVILLHRPAARNAQLDKTLLLAKVAKNKDGPIGTAPLHFDPATMRIGDRSDREDEPPPPGEPPPETQQLRLAHAAGMYHTDGRSVR